MHRFGVTKAQTDRYSDDIKSGAPNSDQLKAFGVITDILHEITLRRLKTIANWEALVRNHPFLLFELSADLCYILGLKDGCWIMFELSGGCPTILFEDNDMHVLQHKGAAALEDAASRLHYHVNDPKSCVLVMKQ
jgi:hypothetical protein